MKALAIAGSNLRRFLRDRSNIFFVFVFPMLLVLIIGAVFGGSFVPKLAVGTSGDGELELALVEALQAEDGYEVRLFASAEAAVEDVERGTSSAAVLIPPGYDERLLAGEVVEIEFVASGSFGLDLQSTVQGVVATQSARILAASFVADGSGGSIADGLAAIEAVEGFVAGVDVEVTGAVDETSSLGQFDLGAAQNVALFVFVNALPAASQLVLTRKLRISQRMLSTPTAVRTIIVGEALGRFLVAFFQGAFIIVAAAVFFGVDWGDPLAVLVLLTAFSLTATSLAMLLGSVFDNDQQLGGVGVGLGLGMAALGGAMIPLEVFSDTMRNVAHLTPHAWLLDAFGELIRHDAGLGDILTEVGVLAAGALVVGLLAIWRFRVKLVEA